MRSDSNYIDPDILALIRGFKNEIGPARGVDVSLMGFRDEYELKDNVTYADFSIRELRDEAEPDQVLQILKEGNKRFYSGQRIARDFGKQVDGSAAGSSPLALVVSCIDSRVPTELVFDLGVGDILSVRVAGNVNGTKSLGSIEYGLTVPSTKLILVLGHTRCGIIERAMALLGGGQRDDEPGGIIHGPNLSAILDEIKPSVLEEQRVGFDSMNEKTKESCVDEVARKNVLRAVSKIVSRSKAVQTAVDAGTLKVVGAMYDVTTGKIDFYDAD